MHIFKWLLVFLAFIPFSVEAQLSYTFQRDIVVFEDDTELIQPFSGGFIAPQFSAIDLNLNGIDDLFVFDRASGKVSTFLWENDQYIYSPQFEDLFPPGLNNWVLLRDYNCDGKKDLFTSSLFGMSLYVNTSEAQLSWKLESQTIFTEGSNGQTNLQVSDLDLPAIGDVDNDGDVDILVFNFATGGGIEFHKNLSIENAGICDIELVRATRKYGDFEECTCETYVFGSEECTTGGREEHAGGKSILSFNYNNDQVQDVVIGQEFCNFPGYLPNSGTVETAAMTSASFDFPDVNQPLRIEYPAFFELDLFNNGNLNLLAAPNNYITDGTQNYQNQSFLYEKDNQGNYLLVKDGFLKEEMIDVGHKAAPVFTDLDFDGDEDLLIGTGIIDGGATIWMYENTGTSTKPAFKLISQNYLSLKDEGLESIKIQFFHVDDNNLLDLVLFKVINNDHEAEVLLHTGNSNEPYVRNNNLTLSLPEFSIWDSPHFFSLSGKTGLLIGKQVGNLEYYNTSNSLGMASWNLVSSNYLGIEEDFKKRNLRVVVADMNANGSEDMLAINDSGEILVYENFLNANNPLSIAGTLEEKGNSFDLNFGKLANPAVSNLFNTLEPTLVFGQLQGGLYILKNVEETDGDNKLDLNVMIYPNPVENHQVQIQSNKNGIARVIDVSGKLVINYFELLARERLPLQLVLDDGIYFIEVISEDKEKKVARIAIID